MHVSVIRKISDKLRVFHKQILRKSDLVFWGSFEWLTDIIESLILILVLSVPVGNVPKDYIDLSSRSRTIDDTSHVRVNLDGIFLYRIYTQPNANLMQIV